MNIEIAAICDAATANDAGGRLNILGAFDRIFAKFPLVIPQCSAAFRLRYQRSEAGTHQLSLSIELRLQSVCIAVIVIYIRIIHFFIIKTFYIIFHTSGNSTNYSCCCQ